MSFHLSRRQVGGATASDCHEGASSRGPFTCACGLDLSRNRVDVYLLSEHGELVAEFATPSDADGVLV
jgi:hypothetical protein